MILTLSTFAFVVGCSSTKTADATTVAPTLKDKPAIETPAHEIEKPVVEAPTPELQKKNSDGTRNIPERLYQLADLKKATIKVGTHELQVWVVDTEMKRQEGMMFLKNTDFTEKQGFLFIFAEEQPLRFWMKNTLVDLDIAYIGENKVINTALTMRSLDTTTDYSSHKPSMYALEVKAGWFSRNRVPVGTKVEIPKELVAKE